MTYRDELIKTYHATDGRILDILKKERGKHDEALGGYWIGLSIDILEAYAQK